MKLSTSLSTKSTMGALPAILLAVLTLSGLGWVASRIFHGLPLCMDEYSYLYQARIFASGRFYLPVPHGYAALAELYMPVIDGKLVSKYAPLWAALLSLGERAGLAAFVNPVLSTLTVLIVYKTVLLYASRRIATLTALLLATNAYFIGYGASLFAQPTALLLSTAAISCYCHYAASLRTRTLAVAGGLAALLCLSRLPDALCVTLAVGAGILMTGAPWRRRCRDLLIFGGITLVGPALLVLYNYLLAGRASLALYAIGPREFRIVVPGETLGQTIALSVIAYGRELQTAARENFSRFFLPNVGWLFLGLAGLGAVVFRRPLRWIVLIHVVLLVAIYNFHPGLGWPQYGSRYWYPFLAGLAFLAGGGLVWVERRIGRTATLAVAMIAVCLQILTLSGHLQVYSDRFDTVHAVRADIFRSCPTPAVVVLTAPPKDSSWWVYRPAMVLWFDFRRNPFFAGPHHYALSTHRGGAATRALFPDLPLCVYDFGVFDRRPGRKSGKK